MRLLSVSIALTTLASVSWGQTYSKIAPNPAAGASGVCFTTPRDGWIVGGLHSCYRTTDGGLTWQPVVIPGPASTPLYSISFITPSIGIISGNSATDAIDMFRTTNGGATWSQIAGFPLGGSWYHQSYVSSTTGFLGANGALAKTVDAGASWLIRSAYPDCPVIYGMDFTGSTGLVAGYQICSGLGGIFKTVDGGATWLHKYSGNANDAVFLSTSVAVADDGAGVVRSIDGGNTWSSTGANVPTGMVDLEKVSASVVLGVSGGGDVWRSNDGGMTWFQTLVGQGDLPDVWMIRFVDESHGFVVGPGPFVYSTQDGGYSWTQLNRGIGAEWMGLAAFNDNHVVLAGYHGYVQTTFDAGKHWATQNIDKPTFGRDTYFTDVAITGANTAVAVGHWGGMFRTNDGGVTWQSQVGTPSYNYYANRVLFTDANNGWLVGTDYSSGPKTNVLQTHDGGVTWSASPNINVNGLDIAFQGNNGWILPASSAIYRTLDGGATWTGLTVSPWGTPMRMSWSSSQIGYICGFDGYVVRTTNAGTSWTQLPLAQSNFVYLDVLAIGSKEVWVCGAAQGGGNAVVRRSLDGGQTWRTWNLPGSSTTPYRFAKTKRYVYVSGYSGDVWRFDLLSGIQPRAL